MSKLLDYLLLPLSLWIATYLRFHTLWFDLRELYLLMSAIIAWAIASSLLQIYSGDPKSSTIYRRIPTLIAFFFIMTGMSFYAHNELDFSRIVLVLFTLIQFILPPLLLHILERTIVPANHPSHYRTLIIGTGTLFETIVEEYSRKKKQFSTCTDLSQLPLLISGEASAKAMDCEEIVIVTEHLDRQLNDALLHTAQARGIRCQIITDNHHLSTFSLKAETINDRTYYRPLINRLERRDNRIAKRLFDIVGSLVLISAISPLLLLVAVILKLTAPREPLLFRQKRTGYNQKLFFCYKFRSMISNAEADTKQATQGDSRITPFGAFMRRTSIDELPQLFNVLIGDMSLVGPRPHPVVMNDLQEQVPDYLLRHFVLPGITGWAQINGWRGPTDTDERIQKRIECDLWYVENWSICLDLKILFLTVFSRKTWEGAF